MEAIISHPIFGVLNGLTVEATTRRALRFMTDPRRKDVEALGLGKCRAVASGFVAWLRKPPISPWKHMETTKYGVWKRIFLVDMAIFLSFHVELRGFKIKHYLQAETAIELLDHDCNSVSFNGVCRLSQQGLVSVWGRLLGHHVMVMGCGVGCLRWVHWIPQNAESDDKTYGILRFTFSRQPNEEVSIRLCSFVNTLR